ncbi:MAG: hypothetical protein U0457_17995 [Candidatus Sericytochromatia bacterium]
MKKTSVPLKKVINEIIGVAKSNKYLSVLDFAYADSSDIYQGALANLINGNTEKAIKCIIFGLDLDRDNNSIIHLSRTMLFSLSEDFYESGGDLFRQKYGSLEKTKIQLAKKKEELNIDISLLEEKLKEKKTELEKNTSLMFKLFKAKNLKKEISFDESNISLKKSEYEILEVEYDKSNSLERIEEYIKVLGVILEVCIFPARFSWALNA